MRLREYNYLVSQIERLSSMIVNAVTWRSRALIAQQMGQVLSRYVGINVVDSVFLPFLIDWGDKKNAVHPSSINRKH